MCTGNLCRSPMAEGLFRVALDRRACRDVDVESSGTWAYVGSPPTSEGVEVVGRLGGDISMLESRPLDRAQVDDADVVVAMTSVHLREIAETAPGSEHKTYLIKELAEIDPPLQPSGGLAALAAGRRPPWRRALDLDDPIGLPLAAYERCARQISEGVELLADVLCGAAPTSPDSGPPPS